MCSIAGVITNSPSKFIKNKQKIFKAMDHRGPDFKDFKIDYFGKKKIILFYSRLAINGFGNQNNKIYSNNKIDLLFNGELYEYKKIKEKLASKGVKFKAETDTEVVGNIIAEKGLKNFFLMDNMFAMATHFKKEKKLTLSVDLYGQKKIYYFYDKKNFYFASEIQLLKKIINFKLKINLKKISLILQYNYKATHYQDLFYKKIKCLGNNSSLIIDQDLKLKKIKNISLNFQNKNFYSARKIIFETKKNLLNSVNNKLHPDLKNAIFLSGGVDSNCIFSIAKKSKAKIHTFSIVSDTDYTEKKIIEKILTKNDLKNHTWINYPKNNFLKNLKKITQYHASPLPTLSNYLFYFAILKMKKSGIRILLDGTGGDELYFGYYHHLILYLYNLSKTKNNNAKINIKIEKNFYKYYSDIIKNPTLKNFKKFSKKKLKEFTFNDNHSRLFIRKNFLTNPPAFKKYSKDKINNYLLNELFKLNIPNVITPMDLNSSMNSIENRAPFLNYKIFKIFLNTNKKYMLNKGILKYSLRNAFKNYLPKNVFLSKRKIGLNINVTELIKNDKSIMNFVKKKSDIFKIIKKASIIKLFKNIYKEKNLNFDNEMNKFIFTFIAIKVFMDCNRK